MRIINSFLLVVIIFFQFTISATADVSNMIAYQGRITDDASVPIIDGVYSIKFKIYGSLSGDDSLWSSDFQSVPVTNGIFTYYLGFAVLFPEDLFGESNRYIGMTISGEDEMVPRKRMISTPYSLQSLRSDTADYALASSGGGTSGWTDAGNTVSLITTEDSVGIGTTLPQAKLHVEGNLYVTSNVTFGQGNTNTGYQAFVSGESNSATGSYTAIVNGTGHEAISDYSAIISGQNNKTTGGTHSVVIGGNGNVASGPYSVIAGGVVDSAIGMFTFVNGLSNKAEGDYSSITGGEENETSGEYSIIGGGAYNLTHGKYSTISGGGPSDEYNPSSTNNVVYDDFGTISGGAGNKVGDDNSITDDQTHATVSGGFENTASSIYSTVGGGNINTANGYISTVSGGNNNTASANYTGVASGNGNSADGTGSSVGGGESNNASQNYSRIGGGKNNNANGQYSSITGGLNNTINGNLSSINGGIQNVVSGDYSSIFGGYADTIEATASYSYLFGIGSKLTEDSTFMVDLPHIRFGDETIGYEFPTADGASGEVMISDGSGQLTWTDPTTLEPRWTLTDSVLYTSQYWGIARGGVGNGMYGDSAHTLVNLGVNCGVGYEGLSLFYGKYASITGGHSNNAMGSYSHIGGGVNNRVESGYSSIVGGIRNFISYEESHSSFIGGGSQDTIFGINSVIGGGSDNLIDGDYSFIGGGDDNSANNNYAAVVGGYRNSSSNFAAFIGGGVNNLADGNYSVVAGGGIDSVFGIYGCILGGYANRAGNEPIDTFAVVVGGFGNSADSTYAFVGNGYNNKASGKFATIGGGRSHLATGKRSAILGGYDNGAGGENAGVGAGQHNYAGGNHSFVGGGDNDTASGHFSCIPGGTFNKASGNVSFAAGNRAHALHNGSVVISANQDYQPAGTDEIISGCAEQIVLRADDNFYLTNANSTAPCTAGRFLNTSTGGYLSSSGDWTNNSDKNRKENFEAINGQTILELLDKLEITRWNYKDDDDVKHIGPMAQDFYALFGLGNDDVSISSIDPGGIALAAIQELHKKTKQLENQQQEIDELRAQLLDLTEKVKKID